MIWKASWIWASGGPDTSAQYLLFRRAVMLRQPPRLASAFCTASREYQLYVNGRFVGHGPPPGGPRWQPYDAHDLAPYLARGRNAIAALCFHDGDAAAPSGFLFQVAIDAAGDPPLEIVTDRDWRVWRAAPWRSPGGAVPGARRPVPGAGQDPLPNLAPGTGHRAHERSEICDSRREPEGWMLPAFDDAGWETPVCLGPANTPPFERLVPRQIPPLREEPVAPVVRHDPDSDTRRAHCLDFGRLVVGYPRVRVPASAAGTLDLAYGDWTDAEGRVVTRPGEPLQEDLLVLPGRKGRRAGSEPFTWQPFGRRAFRYLHVALRDDGSSPPQGWWPLAPDGITVTAVGYPVEEQGAFRCSDPLLTEIWALGRHTLRRAMQEQFEKCPIRAPVQTVPDTRIDALINFYAFGDYRLLGKALWQLSERQLQAPGSRLQAGTKAALPLPGLAPGAWSLEREERSDELLWVLMLADYLRYSGDERLVRQLYPEVRARLAWFHRATNEHGLVAFGGREETALNALYVAALREGMELARRLGETGREDEHRGRSVRHALNWSLWSESEHAFAEARTRDGLTEGAEPHANWLVLYLEVAEPARSRLVLRRLLSDRPAVLRLAPAFQLYVLESLFREGYTEDALDLIRSVWGEMLRRGATTCWERLDGTRRGEGMEEPAEPPTGSLCHASSGAPTYFLPARILGVMPQVSQEGDGASRSGIPSPAHPVPLRVRPCPAGLEWAEGAIPTLRGPARFGWRQAEEFELTADLPPDVQADLLLPVRAGEVAAWDGRVFWPVERAEHGVELEHPAERTPEGLRVHVTGPRRVTLTTTRL